MARFDKPRLLGDVVYEKYSPLALGRVIEVIVPGENPYQQTIRVRWKDTKSSIGPTEVVAAHEVLRLDDLIEDHQKKLNGHIARRDAVIADIPLPEGV